MGRLPSTPCCGSVLLPALWQSGCQQQLPIPHRPGARQHPTQAAGVTLPRGTLAPARTSLCSAQAPALCQGASLWPRGLQGGRSGTPHTMPWHRTPTHVATARRAVRLEKEGSQGRAAPAPLHSTRGQHRLHSCRHAGRGRNAPRRPAGRTTLAHMSGEPCPVCPHGAISRVRVRMRSPPPSGRATAAPLLLYPGQRDPAFGARRDEARREGCRRPREGRRHAARAAATA
eukprot:3627-Chlamydomonas_euryale.AAC.2